MKILIADDEIAVHEQLVHLIPWEKLGWKIIGHAYNGQEAKRLTEQFRPQLVLTDIRMPLMDGLEFMSWLEQSGIHSKVIVLSGYGEFEYTRSAFLHGAHNYLLKPIQESELLQALAKVVEQIQQETQRQTNQLHEKAVLVEGMTLMADEFLSQLIGFSITDENEIHVQAQKLLLQLPETHYAVVIVRFVDFEEQMVARYEGDRPAIYYAIRNVIQEAIGQALVWRNLYTVNEFIVIKELPDKNLNAMNPMLNYLQRSLSDGLRMRSVIGVSTPKQRAAKIVTAYEEAQQALETLRMTDNNSVALHDGKTKPKPRSLSQTDMLWKEIGLLFDLLAETGSLRDNNVLIDKLENVFSEEILRDASVSEWKRAMTTLLQKLKHYVMDEDMQMMLNEVKSSVQAFQFQQTKKALLKWTASLMIQNNLENRSKSGKPLIEVIRKYIDDQYRTVSLDEIAEQFHINKNYFCSLFKNTTGTSFLEYVTSLRMKHAQQLLSSSTLKTYEISDIVGYQDQRYFSQVFRKYTGQTPTDYRLAQEKTK
ncbi:response regulator [Paenibacillus sp.]